MKDLRQLLETAKGDGPGLRYGVDDIVAAGRRRGRRVMALRVGGAGVGVAAAVTGAALVAGTLAPTPDVADAQPSKGTSVELPSVTIPALTFAFGSYQAGAFKVLTPYKVTTTYQSASISTEYRDGTGHPATAYIGTLTVYRPGVSPPPASTFGTKTTVAGRPGFVSKRSQYLNTFDGQTGAITGHVNVDAVTLAWQYADKGWAVIDGAVELAGQADYAMKESDERALAEAFDLGTQSRARMPFNVGYMPGGWQVVSVFGRSLTGDDDQGGVSIVFAPSSAAGTDKIRQFADRSDGPAVEIYIGHQQPPPPDAPKQKNKNDPICGRFVDDVLSCSWNLPGSQFFVLVKDLGNTLSTEELVKIREGLTFDDIASPDTWHIVP